MRYLGLALFAEGPSDHRFLRPLLRRLCGRICLRDAAEVVDVGNVIELHSPSDLRDAPRKLRIVEAALRAAPAWDVLFVHTDGAGSPDKARAERIDPALENIATRLDVVGRGVAVVPVRETEAWILADGEAVERTLGVAGIETGDVFPSRPRDVEKVQTPKSVLEAALRDTGVARRSAGFFELFGETVSFERLSRVPAFQGLSTELEAALRSLKVLRG